MNCLKPSERCRGCEAYQEHSKSCMVVSVLEGIIDRQDCENKLWILKLIQENRWGNYESPKED